MQFPFHADSDSMMYDWIVRTVQEWTGHAVQFTHARVLSGRRSL